MKQTFYCVQAEFYADGSRKLAVTSRACKEKPLNQKRKYAFMNAYRDWFESLDEAKAFLMERKM